MTINYVLVENHLTSDPDDYMARVISSGTADFDALVDDILSSGSTVTHPDILAVLNAYHTAITKRLLAGQRVVTPVANFSVSIKGRFESIDDVFDKSRHVVQANVGTGAQLRGDMRDQSQTARGEEQVPGPHPTQYYDFGSESTNSLLIPNNPGELTGHRLKGDPTDPRQGVFFIAASDGAETRATMMMRNKPANLMFMVPDGLASGDYEIEVRTIVTQDNVVRRGRLRRVVSVP